MLKNRFSGHRGGRDRVHRDVLSGEGLDKERESMGDEMC